MCYRGKGNTAMDILYVLLLTVVATQASEVGPPVIKEHPASMVARRNDPATLNCAATGASRIRWFRDGEEVTTASEDPQSHRILLPSGSLFFLRVTSSRRGGDAGTYWCVASNSYSATRSKNATLTVASLGHDFIDHPMSLVKVQIGETIKLPCKAPKGSPLPHINWLKNGKVVNNSTRVITTFKGDLIIKNAAQVDSGSYVCQAQNIVGTRETKPTTVTILIPPWFMERPANVTIASGAKVEFICDVQGSPKPFVTWRRLDGKMPFGRTTKTDYQHLIIKEVIVQDSGVYVCEAENEAGVTIAEARLVVVATPEVAQRPHDKHVLAGESTTLDCKIQGDPSPIILWRLPHYKSVGVLTSGQNRGTVSVSEDGTSLKIEKTSIENSGTYACWGVSSGGGISSHAEIQVVEAYPPPMIGVGPQDLNIAPGAMVTFPCEPVSESSPPTVTWWYQPMIQDTVQQVIGNKRFMLPPTGALIIKDVEKLDSGIYTCRISAGTGIVEQAAILQVVNEANEISELTNLPAPPSKPKVKAHNETSVHLTWHPNSQITQGIKLSYILEYWRMGWDEWRVANALIVDESCLISDLTPGVTYTFLVRAVTNKGPSFPSPWSDPIVPHRPSQLDASLEEIYIARRRLSRPTISLTNATPLSPDSVVLTWEHVNHHEGFMDGIMIYTIGPNNSIKEYTVLGSLSSTYTLKGLAPYTEYTFFIVPFWKIIEGTPSNSFTIRTPEDVPMISPSNVMGTLRNVGTMLITWSPLTQFEAQGRVLAFKVLITHQNSQISETTQNPWLEVNGLEIGGLYTVRVAAMTSAGYGPYSSPILVDTASEAGISVQDTSENPTSVIFSPPQPDWLLYMLVPVVILISVLTLLYVRRLRYKGMHSHSPHSQPVYQDPSMYSGPRSVNMYGEQKLWWPAEVEIHGSLTSSKMRNEYAEPKVEHSNETAEPYATTALLSSSPRPMKSPQWSKYSDDSGVQVNWAAIIPPPPSCPPPIDRDLGDPRVYSEPGLLLYKGSSHYSQYDNRGSSEQHYEWPCNTNSNSTQDVYSDILPPKGGSNRFFTFNSLNRNGYHKGHTENIPKQGEVPTNNTQ
ncbi:unnamed protein product [Meganyctiphanes norvegica]|uniref:Uncharacterized protein n=1 Tax=Meganyctiphanes norvegica TaxID=48144 RepID=A0AAV2PLR4_MEGNR